VIYKNEHIQFLLGSFSGFWSFVSTLLIAFLVIVPRPLNAQNSNDELYEVWNDQSKPEDERLNALHEVCFNYMDNNQYDTAYALAILISEQSKQSNLNVLIGQSSNSLALIHMNMGRMGLSDSILSANITYSRTNNLENSLCQALNLQGKLFWIQGKLDEGLVSLEEVLKHGYCTADSSVLAENYGTTASIYYSKGMFEKSYRLFELAYKAYEASNSPGSMAVMRNNLALVASEMGDYNLAIEQYFEALAEMPDDFAAGRATLYNNIGRTYFILELFEDARRYSLIGLSIAKEAELIRASASLHNNLGKTYLAMDSLDQAEKHIREALEIRTENGLESKLAISHIFLGDVFRKRKQFQEAISHYNQGIELAKRLNQSREQSVGYEKLAKMYLEADDLNKASASIEKSLEFAKRSNSLEHVIGASSLGAEIYLKQKNYKRRSELLQLFITYEDSLNDESVEKDLLRKDLAYNYAPAAHRDSVETAALLQLQQAEIDQEKSHSKLRWVGIFVFAVLLAIFFQRYRITQKQKVIIESERQKLNKANEKLIGLDKMKSDFFANVSHEFRTPLTLILGPVNRLLKAEKTESNDQKYLTTIKENAQQLNTRINQILDLSRLDAEQFQLKKEGVQFKLLLERIIGNYASALEDKTLTLKFDHQFAEVTEVNLDVDKYRDVVNNLLSNAIKYTPAGGRILVTSFIQNDQIVLAVKDSGIGIPKEDLPALFNRFYQAKNSERSNSSGIGLAFCSEIAKRMNGTVIAESQLGQGSTFTFSVPMEGVEATVKAPSPVSLNEGTDVVSNSLQKSGLSILLVEDNESLREYITDVLSPAYNVATAENGQIGLDILRQKQTQNQPFPNLIISDVMMPVMDGLEFLKNIKNSDQFRHLPIVMLTAKASLESKLTALRLGVDDYMIKPFDENELLIRIQRLLQNQQDRLEFLKTDAAEINQEEETGDGSALVSKSEQEWLVALENIVHENSGNSEFSLLDCAEAMQLSERQFRRRLKRGTGMTYTKYMRLARLTKARLMLETGEKETIAEVAYAVGFETPSYFSKVFNEEFGKKPQSYLIS
jgi:signal transduction histidine kinase/DNA-binding response OmpR family regulator/Tfp pilus assembly protein PilF